jgi:hypothetical protein
MKRLLCRLFGHKNTIWVVSKDYWVECEQCERCGHQSGFELWRAKRRIGEWQQQQ